jgi:hypothetical protein
MHIHIHTYIHTYMHTYIHIHTYIYIHTYTNIYMRDMHIVEKVREGLGMRHSMYREINPFVVHVSVNLYLVKSVWGKWWEG